jgi:hypothetical protein
VIDAALPGLHDWVDRSLAGEVHPAKEGHLAAERPEDECVG